MKLYDFPLSPNCLKVRALLYELDLPFERVQVELGKGESRAPAFLAKNPMGKIPVLEDGDLFLWESNAILNYVASKAGPTPLLPTNPRERAEVDRWMFWQAQHLAPTVLKLVFELVMKKRKGLEPDQAQVDAGMAEYKTLATVFDKSLGTKEYVAGRLTVADFSLVAYFNNAKRVNLTFDEYPTAKAWFARMMERGSVKRAIADIPK